MTNLYESDRSSAQEVDALHTNENIKLPEVDIESLVKVYGCEIFSYCYHLLRSKEDAEDAVQEIFLKAYNNLSKKKIDSVSFWLYKVAYHHCLNILRKRKFKIQISFDDNMLSSTMTPEDALMDSEFSEQTQKALDMLSDLQKSILILKVVQCFNYEDISKIMNRKPEAIRKNYERAKKRISMCFNVEKGVEADERT